MCKIYRENWSSLTITNRWSRVMKIFGGTEVLGCYRLNKFQSKQETLGIQNLDSFCSCMLEQTKPDNVCWACLQISDFLTEPLTCGLGNAEELITRNEFRLIWSYWLSWLISWLFNAQCVLEDGTRPLKLWNLSVKAKEFPWWMAKRRCERKKVPAMYIDSF